MRCGGSRISPRPVACIHHCFASAGGGCKHQKLKVRLPIDILRLLDATSAADPWDSQYLIGPRRLQSKQRLALIQDAPWSAKSAPKLCYLISNDNIIIITTNTPTLTHTLQSIHTNLNSLSKRTKTVRTDPDLDSLSVGCILAHSWLAAVICYLP